jgi:hypothetical protein
LKKYAIVVGSGSMIFIPDFINIASGFQMFLEGTFTQTPTDSKVIS